VAIKKIWKKLIDAPSINGQKHLASHIAGPCG